MGDKKMTTKISDLPESDDDIISVSSDSYTIPKTNRSKRTISIKNTDIALYLVSVLKDPMIVLVLQVLINNPFVSGQLHTLLPGISKYIVSISISLVVSILFGLLR